MTAAFYQRLSLLDEVILNPRTPEEEALVSAHIASECEKIHEDRRKALEKGIRTRGLRPLPDNFRMPPVYRFSTGGGSPSFLGSH